MKRAITLATKIMPRQVCEPVTLCCVKHRNEYVGATVIYPNGVVVDPPCRECIEADIGAISLDYSREQQAHRSQALNKKIGHSGIPRRFLDSSFDGFRIDNDGQSHALDICRGYAETFKANLDGGDGLIFIGPPGTGKTHLATAICREVIRQGRSALFTGTLEFTQIIKETYMASSETSERQAIQEFVAPDLLVLDEVGVQHQSKVECMLMTELINQRYSAMRPTILLSNMEIDDLKGLLGERVISRLREVSQVVMFTWEDQRKRSA
ncbi:MAG: ATP-binding protein [Proteobacteria bacterium]|nr:ATP-binding protein [Pseudomonadota bacterium]